MQIGASLGYVASLQLHGDQVSELTLAPASIGVGGFVSDRVALFGRLSASVFEYSPTSSGTEYSRLTSQTTRMIFLGMTAQTWLRHSVAVEGGLGLATLGNGPVESRLDRGLGIPIRGLWAMAQPGNSALAMTWELLPAFFSRGELTVATTFGVQWQWF